MSEQQWIRFPNESSDQIDIGRLSGIEALLDLGAVARSSRWIVQEGQRKRQVNTDAEGIRRAYDSLDSASRALHVGIAAVGELMAYAETDEIRSGTWRDLGFFLSGLNTLQLRIADAQTVLSEAVPGAVTQPADSTDADR